MKKQKTDKRLLSYHYPEIIRNPLLPINVQFSSHYTKLDVDENGKANNIEIDNKLIKIKKLQCTMFEFIVFYKPISRVFDE